MNDKPFANGRNDARRGIDFIGVTCVFVCHDGKGKVLLHKRSQHCRDEQGNWDTGAGAHEFGADMADTVRREVSEEYGAEAQKLQFIKAYDAHRQLADGTPTHWLVVVYAVLVDPMQVSNHEPYKIDEIGWYAYDTLPNPLHSQVTHTLDSVHAAGII
jgi:8-oxo-dGTP pyrophosphatase MutT (NUDIX family)